MRLVERCVAIDALGRCRPTNYEIKMSDPPNWAPGGLAAEMPLDISHHYPAIRRPPEDQMRTATLLAVRWKIRRRRSVVPESCAP
jgi:hypothetical protein